MNTKNILITGLVGAVITLILTNVPFISLVNCLVCAGWWVGPLFATWLYKRMSGTLSTKEGIWVGVAAGAIAGVIGFFLSFFNLAGISGMVTQLNSILPPEGQIELGGVEAGIFNLIGTSIGIIIDIVFGIIGGYIGTLIFKDKTQTQIQS
jgi:uncharacterized membrane protein YeaQ/YmgE (transglycosylase-associated protein family)